MTDDEEKEAVEHLTLEQAKEELEKVMESGDRKELEELIKRSYEETELAIAIMDVLFPDATE